MTEETELPLEVQEAIGTLKGYLELPAEPEAISRLLGFQSMQGPPGTVHGQITKKQWLILALLRSINNQYKSQVLKDFIDGAMEFSISIDRQSRKEWKEVLTPNTEEPGRFARLREGIAKLWKE